MVNGSFIGFACTKFLNYKSNIAIFTFKQIYIILFEILNKYSFRLFLHTKVKLLLVNCIYLKMADDLNDEWWLNQEQEENEHKPSDDGSKILKYFFKFSL